MSSRTVERHRAAPCGGAMANGRTLLGVLAVGVAVAVLGDWQGPVRGASPGDLRAGKDLYETLCAVCHGPTGRGDGPALRGVPVHPTSFADASALRNVSDQALFESIQKGGAATGKSPLMPPFGDQLKEGQIRDLVAYLRSLAAAAR